MTKTDLTREDVLHIAGLASLELTDSEITKFHNQLAETINYVENLNELKTVGVEPTAHSTHEENVFFEDGTENTRQFTQEDATYNAKSVKNGSFVVKRILE